MAGSTEATVVDRPLVAFGREVCGDLEAGLRREWLATNGLGGFASGTVAGINTRRYHGLLVAALEPPGARTVLVASLVEWATYDGRRYPLFTLEYADGTIDGRGYRFLESLALEGAVPVFRYALGDALLERRVWMAHGANTTYVQYRQARGSGPIALEVTPLVTYRDPHTLGVDTSRKPEVSADATGLAVRFPGDARPYSLRVDAGRATVGGDWWWSFHHREEAARGLDDRSNLYAPGRFDLSVSAGDARTLVLSAEGQASLDGDAALGAELDRQRRLIDAAGTADADPVAQQMTLAADQFIVRRAPPPGPGAGNATRAASTVIAGYHWFADWGRDTMIALSGLTLAAGRPEDAADVLRTFARYVRDGLLPNNLPDRPGTDPGYNTVDASLWYVVAAHAYEMETGDASVVGDLLPVLRDIVDSYTRGTRYGIGVDPADGLLRAGEPGVQLTWMDAKVGDWVVTPRVGKPVEINALWYNALCMLAALLRARRDQSADRYADAAARVLVLFRQRFWRPEKQYLADVVDGPSGDDLSLRPNQVFALSLPFPLLDGDRAAAVLRAVGRSLATTYGLRSLSPDDPAYQGTYGGGPRERDGAYHQGTVWTWLMGAYVEAYAKVHGTAAALDLLRPFEHHLRDAGLGSISEILDGDPPHHPRGCIAQAWGVAEVLRVWRKLSTGR